MTVLANKQDFLENNHLTKEQFESTGLQWQALKAINEDYNKATDELDSMANYMFNTLIKP